MRGKNFFIGFRSVAAPDALSFMEEPVAPSNYKKADVIAEYKEKARETFMEKAPYCAFTGQLAAVMVVNASGTPVMSAKGYRDGMTSCALVKWLLDVEFDQYPAHVGERFSPSRWLWGLDVQQLLRMACMEVVRYGAAINMPYPPLRLWYENSGVRDPYDILTNSAERKVLSMASVCRYIGIDYERFDVEAPNTLDGLATLSLQSAMLAREMCTASGMVNPEE